MDRLSHIMRTNLTRLRLGWLCLVSLAFVTLIIGTVTEVGYLVSFSVEHPEILPLRLPVTGIVFLLVIFVLFSSTVIFWKAETQTIGILLPLTLLFYWTTDSTPFDLLTKSDMSPLAPFFRVPILVMRAASLPMVLALLFTFPDGHFSPRWSRWLLVGYSFLTLIYLLVPELPTNTIYGGTWRQTIELSFAVAVIPFFIGIYAQIKRYRRSDFERRNQLKWTALGMVIMVIGVMLYYLVLIFWGGQSDYYDPIIVATLETLRQFIQLTLAVILPITCFMIAIFRYKLWSADPIINRVLVYSAFVGIITLIYLVSIILIGMLFSTINFVVSIPVTILILLIFQPLRERIQRTVNQLMFGERDNPYAVIAQLSAEVQASTTSETILPTIAEMLAQALKIPYVAIALVEEGELKSSVIYGQLPNSQRLMRVPMTYGQAQLGEIVLCQDWGDRSWTAEERHLVENVARQTAAVIHTMQLNAALQQSRQHLISAREEERRRLRRDLHDGLGPTLAAHALKVGKARTLIDQKPQTAVAILSALETELATSLTEIRRLVYDLRPPILDQLGLVGAIREFIYPLEGIGADGIAPRFNLHVPVALPSLSAAVEVAAYRIITEAITNVVRHARASTCSVRLDTSYVLQLSVVDDGIGLPESVRYGVGLNSMRERAEEVGGSILFESASPTGMQVIVRLPIA